MNLPKQDLQPSEPEYRKINKNLSHPKKRLDVTQPDDPTYRLIPLTKGQVALIDTKHYGRLSQYNWQAHWSKHTGTFYVHRAAMGPNGKREFFSMHREVMGVTDRTILVDHRDRSLTLDNRECNLRIANRSQNGWNSKKKKSNRSGIKGIYFHAANGKWIAQISINRKHQYLGSFITKDDALEAYKKAATEHYGEFARFE